VKKTRVDRADGRYLYYYAFDAPSPAVLDAGDMARGDEHVELRWNALLGEYVIVSTGRQGRTFLPPDAYCPLCPTASPEAFATEIPSKDYEIVVFENRFPSFRPDAPEVYDGGLLEQRARAEGVCEVIVYSSQHDGSLASGGVSPIRRLIDVWADRYAELGRRSEVSYVFIFENRGREIGVTLTHPHGQAYAMPFVPPRVETEHAAAAVHHAQTGHCLVCDVVASERRRGERIVGEAAGFVAYVPFAARVPYEVHVAATEHRPSLLDLPDAERDGLARVLHDLQRAYDAMWGFAMPYTMSMHQQATDGIDRASEHLHIEFLPPYRTRDKLKYLAGVETGAGTYINDTAPEATARDLRDAWPPA